MLAFSVLRRRRRVTVRARAKVNLALEVLGRRGDGYHELLSCLAAIDLADRVTLEAIPAGIELECDAPGLPSSPANLAWRAAELWQRETGVVGGVRIRLEKAIPVAAGLGGGSADAAAVLVGLGHLWRQHLSSAELHRLGTRLGMDVPFFLGPGPALAAGRGEELTPVAFPRSVPLVVVNPGFPLSTREVYARLQPGDFSSGDAVRELVSALAAGGAGIAPWLRNGLEPPVAAMWPGLAEIKAALLAAGALGAVMSGSGPTVIGLARSRQAAGAIRRALANRPWRTWSTRTVPGPALSVGEAREARRGRARAWGVAKR